MSPVREQAKVRLRIPFQQVPRDRGMNDVILPAAEDQHRQVQLIRDSCRLPRVQPPEDDLEKASPGLRDQGRVNQASKALLHFVEQRKASAPEGREVWTPPENGSAEHVHRRTKRGEKDVIDPRWSRRIQEHDSADGNPGGYHLGDEPAHGVPDQDGRVGKLLGLDEFDHAGDIV